MVVRMLSQEFPTMPLEQRMARTVTEEALGLQCAGHLVLWEKEGPVLLWVSRLPIPTPFPVHSLRRTGPAQSYGLFSICPVAQMAASLIGLELLSSEGSRRGFPGPRARAPGVQCVGRNQSPPQTGRPTESGDHLPTTHLGGCSMALQLRPLWTA